MRAGLAKYLDPNRWKVRYNQFINQRRANRLRLAAEQYYLDLGVLTTASGKRAIVADGLWDNPNHWFRLRLFLEALPETRHCRLVGVLRGSHDVAQRRMMKCFGFKDFIYLEENRYEKQDFTKQAREILSDIGSHGDLLRLQLPDSLPAYTYYDTVLKLARHPQPSLDSPLWIDSLSELLRNLAIYQDLFQEYEVVGVVASHPWKNEYATLCWTALGNGVPSFHITGYCEGIRIRRFSSLDDYATPVEHMSFHDFVALSRSVQTRMMADGQTYLSERDLGHSNDINVSYAFLPDKRQTERFAARYALGANDERPLVAIYSHVWFDYPHTFAMSNFTDLLDWMQSTLKQISRNKEVIWLLKPHPTDQWYGGTRLADFAKDLPPHVKICPEDTDSMTVQLAVDGVVTVHGTAGIEAAARGVPVLCADRSYYTDWDFTHRAESREYYGELLSNIQKLSPPTEEQRMQAMACALAALAPVPEGRGLLRLRCDTSGPVLYEDIISLLENDVEALEKERVAMREWLATGSSSYSVFHKVKYYTDGN
jgi:hypothetical protein